MGPSEGRIDIKVELDKAEAMLRLDTLAIEIARKLAQYPCADLAHIENRVKQLLKVRA